MSKDIYAQFTEAARQAMAEAENQAQGFRHEYIGTEHILLAVVTAKVGVSGDVLRALGMTPELVQAEIGKLVHFGPESATVSTRPLTPRAKEALEFARQEALVTCQGFVDTEHLLLGLLREPEGVAGVALRNLGLELDRIREEVLKIRVLQMKIVERAVRPVLATTARKLKMREELLAHLTEIYEQERIGGGDPLFATQAASRRFGDPQELARDLQSTVPWVERYEAMLTKWFGWRAPESALRYLSRSAGQMFLGLSFVTALAFGSTISKLGWNSSVFIAMRPFIAMHFLMPLTFLLLGLLYIEQRNTWFGVFGRRRSYLWLLGLSALYVLIVTACASGLVAFSRWNLEPAFFGVLYFAGIGLTAAVGSLVIAIGNGPNEIRDTIWASLDLET